MALKLEIDKTLLLETVLKTKDKLCKHLNLEIFAIKYIDEEQFSILITDEMSNEITLSFTWNETIELLLSNNLTETILSKLKK